MRKLAVGLAALITAIWIWSGRSSPGQVSVPDPLAISGEVSNADFSRLIESLSEPEGYFDTDNFITNETSYLHVVDTLRESVDPGGVYLGVGPDQNFTYIVHTRPELAFIVDIRRQNMLEHLLLKVLIESAGDRKEYLCMLIARDCTGVRGEGSLDDLLDRIANAPPSARVLAASGDHVREVLSRDFPLALGDRDFAGIEYVHRSFAEAGLELRFSSYGRTGAGYPTFREILASRDLEGEQEGYLSTEEGFRWLQNFQRENRLIPVVGDFAGGAAMPRLASLLEEGGYEVSVFYTSNVEFYLAGTDDWEGWLANLARFPFRPNAVFVRSYFPTGWPIHPQNVSPHRATSLVQDVAGFLADAANGRQRTYWDVVARNLRQE
jgi:hypothetical protein